MKKIAVFTSGGDAPGMNACIRSVVRTALNRGSEIIGIDHGYQGMIEGEYRTLKSSDVGNIIQRGGTILRSARSDQFRTKEGRKIAYDQLFAQGIEGVIAIGGDGTFTGAGIFFKEYGIPIIGVPGTIDNDLYGTDHAIGYDTALNTIVEAVDKIKDTAHSHDRLFFVEVMGRDAGFLALRSGIAVGAEAILIPETKTYMEDLIHKLEHKWANKQSSCLIIVAEGDDAGGAYEIADQVKKQFGKYETRVSVLGHLQRGGSPTARDRVLGSRLGKAAVEALMNGQSGEMVGVVCDKIVFTPFEKAIKHHKEINEELLELAEILS